MLGTLLAVQLAVHEHFRAGLDVLSVKVFNNQLGWASSTQMRVNISERPGDSHVLIPRWIRHWERGNGPLNCIHSAFQELGVRAARAHTRTPTHTPPLLLNCFSTNPTSQSSAPDIEGQRAMGLQQGVAPRAGGSCPQEACLAMQIGRAHV